MCFAEDVVVHDHPAVVVLRSAARQVRRCACDRRGTRREDLARPVPLDGGGDDDEPRAVRRGLGERDDRLAGLAEAHVVGEDRAAAAEEEGDALDLVGEESVGERSGARAPRRGLRPMEE